MRYRIDSHGPRALLCFDRLQDLEVTWSHFPSHGVRVNSLFDGLQFTIIDGESSQLTPIFDFDSQWRGLPLVQFRTAVLFGVKRKRWWAVRLR